MLQSNLKVPVRLRIANKTKSNEIVFKLLNFHYRISNMMLPLRQALRVFRPNKAFIMPNLKCAITALTSCTHTSTNSILHGSQPSKMILCE